VVADHQGGRYQGGVTPRSPVMCSYAQAPQPALNPFSRPDDRHQESAEVAPRQFECQQFSHGLGRQRSPRSRLSG
jgi:hypothetical protein